MRFIGNDDWLIEPLDFDDSESFLLRSAVGNIDNLSLQEISPVKFHKNLARIGDIYVAYSKIDPSVSHIWTRLSLRRSAASFCEAL